MWSPLRDRSVVSPLETWNVPAEQSIGVSFVCELAIADKGPPFRHLPEFEAISPPRGANSRLSKGEKKTSKFVTSPPCNGTALAPIDPARILKRDSTNDSTKTPAAFTFSNPIGIVPPDVSDGRDLFVLRCVGQIYNLVNLTPSSTF